MAAGCLLRCNLWVPGGQVGVRALPWQADGVNAGRGGGTWNSADSRCGLRAACRSAVVRVEWREKGEGLGGRVGRERNVAAGCLLRCVYVWDDGAWGGGEGGGGEERGKGDWDGAAGKADESKDMAAKHQVAVPASP